MRETFFLPGKKVYVETVEEAHKIVREAYPNAYREGQINHWLWSENWDASNPTWVAEAWGHPRKPGWWLKVRKEND